jgi:hypothetical protein
MALRQTIWARQQPIAEMPWVIEDLLPLASLQG